MNFRITALFDREICGRVPSTTPGVAWTVTDTDRTTVGEVAVITKSLTGHIDNSSYPRIDVDIQLELTTPTNSTGPVPVIMELTSNIPAKPIPGSSAAPTWQEQVLAKGWGYDILSTASIQADNGEGLTKGIIGLCNKGQPRKLDDCGALRAWAWGVSRALDYCESDKSVNAKQVGVEGHSRWGKAALVTMAYDQRFAIGYWPTFITFASRYLTVTTPHRSEAKTDAAFQQVAHGDNSSPAIYRYGPPAGLMFLSAVADLTGDTDHSRVPLTQRFEDPIHPQRSHHPVGKN